jgi:Flp pilus assembly protein TadD
VVYDEKPLTFSTAWRQRRRWMQGHASVAVRYLGPLIRRAVVARDPVAVDAVVYLASPIWLSMAFLLTIAFVGNRITPLFTYLYPAWVPPLLLVVSCVYPYLALQLEGVSTKGSLRLSTLVGLLALSMCWPLLGLLGLLQHRNRVWIKTEHTRSLSVADVHRPSETAAPARRPAWTRLSTARAISVAMITLIIVSVVAPQIVARRLRKPLEEGATLLLEGRTAEALQRLESARDEAPDDPITYGFLALTHRMRGNQVAALQAYGQAKRLDPPIEETTVAIIDFLLRHRRHPNSERLMTELVSTMRSGPDAYVWAANLFIGRRRLGDAEVIVNDGIKRLGPQTALLKGKGFLLLRQNRPADAVAVLEQARRQAPNDVSLLINLGWAYYYSNRVESTIRVWEQAITLDPRNDALRRDLDRVRRLRPSAGWITGSAGFEGEISRVVAGGAGGGRETRHQISVEPGNRPEPQDVRLRRTSLPNRAA